MTQIVTLVNEYNNLCHNIDPNKSLIHYTALAHLYKYQKAEFNLDYLHLLVRLLGVYPPGTVVRQSDERIGIVITANTEHILHPDIMLYDPHITPKDAAIYNMRDDMSISIANAIKPSDIPPEINDYLRPCTHINYYYETAAET